MPWRKEPAPGGRPPGAQRVTALEAVGVVTEVAEAGAGGGVRMKDVRRGPSHHSPY